VTRRFGRSKPEQGFLAPYTFLIASLVVLIFGPGRASIDPFLTGWVGQRQIQRTYDGGSPVAVQT
jgi:hypothetical protein